MGRKRGGERILGPYPHTGGYRIIHVTADGERTTSWFATAGAATRLADEARAELHRRAEVTLGEALDGYERYLMEKGNKASTVDALIPRLEKFFGREMALNVSALTPVEAQGFYDVYRQKRAVDSHRNALQQAKSFARWMVKAGLVKANPFEGVDGVGKRRRGKLQLREDEMLKWLDVALRRAEGGDGLSLAAIVALVCGLRASEVLNRVARDVDRGGALLVIEGAKTENSNGGVTIPDFIRHLVARRLVGKSPTDRIFEFSKEALRLRVQAISAEAGVPIITTHSLRGYNGSEGRRSGMLPHLVAASLGHASPSMTMRHYVAPGVERRVQQDHRLQILRGGRG